MILAGDNYQKPGIGEGAFQVLQNIGGSKMTQKGQTIFTECSKMVFELTTNHRVKVNDKLHKHIINRVRTGEKILTSDLEKLQLLHLNNICKTHSPTVVKQIQQEAIYFIFILHQRETIQT